MPRTGLVLDPRYLEHDTGHGHPERPERIAALLDLLGAPHPGVVRLAPRFATGEELARVHDGSYVADVERTQQRDWYAFDADTPTCRQSYDVARLAAGGFLQLLDAIVAGEVDNGFAAVRPPGHHAEATHAMGFCLFNNVAVGAAHLRAVHGLERILIVDWDLHHGNGTQHMFERDPGVLFVSTHQYPYYPGTGAATEHGRGDGEGYTVNLALPAGCGDAEYLDAFRRIVVPVAQRYRPQFVLISAGFDAHARDPLGDMHVSSNGFRGLARQLLEVAGETADGRCAALLEGGYDLQAIRASAGAVLEELTQAGAARPPLAWPEPQPVVDGLVRLQQRYWPAG